MRIDRLVTLYFARPWSAFFGKNCANGIPVLMYHSITEAKEPGVRPYYGVNTSPARFTEQIQFLAESGFQSIGVSEFLRELTHPGGFGAKKVVITFDDGFRNFYTQAYPVLKNHGFKAVMFLPTGFIDKQRKSFKGTECLTWNEVRELRREGMEFGSHTVTHPKLRELTWPEIKAELAESKRRMEDELQEGVDTFAFPYAFPSENPRFSTGFTALLGETGYKCCFTTKVGLARELESGFLINRHPVNDHDDLELLQSKVQGYYDWIGFVQLLHKKRKAKNQIIGG